MIDWYKLGFYDGYMCVNATDTFVTLKQSTEYNAGFKAGRAEWSKVATLQCDIEEMYTKEDVEHLLKSKTYSRAELIHALQEYNKQQED